jgi:ferritin-like protein
MTDPDPFILVAEPMVYAGRRKSTPTTLRLSRADHGVMAGWFRFHLISGSQQAMVMADPQGMEQLLTAMLADERLASKARSTLARISQGHRKGRDTMPPS